MKTVQNILRFCLVALVMVQAAAAAPNPPVNPDETRWIVDYPVPEDVGALDLTLSYGFWDPKIDGDLASKKTLLRARVKLVPGQKDVSILVTLNTGESTITVAKVVTAGKGFHIDSTFTRTAIPKPNYDGFYVLAQQPVDPKNPAEMGDVQNAAAWIELGISPQP